MPGRYGSHIYDLSRGLLLLWLIGIRSDVIDRIHAAIARIKALYALVTGAWYVVRERPLDRGKEQVVQIDLSKYPLLSLCRNPTHLMAPLTRQPVSRYHQLCMKTSY